MTCQVLDFVSTERASGENCLDAYVPVLHFVVCSAGPSEYKTFPLPLSDRALIDAGL